MVEDPKKLTRAHKIALGVISIACCCLIGVSAFALVAPDALSGGAKTRLKQPRRRMGLRAILPTPLRKRVGRAKRPIRGTAVKERMARRAIGEQALEAKPAPRALRAARNLLVAVRATSRPAAALKGLPDRALPIPSRYRCPFPAALPTGAFRETLAPLSKKALPPMTPFAQPAFRLA